jgi:hypothetical protein
LVSWGGVLGDFLMNACGSTMCQTFENVDLTPDSTNILIPPVLCLGTLCKTSNRRDWREAR